MAHEYSQDGFTLKDRALAHIATGKRAQTLRELRDALRDTYLGCVHLCLRTSSSRAACVSTSH